MKQSEEENQKQVPVKPKGGVLYGFGQFMAVAGLAALAFVFVAGASYVAGFAFSVARAAFMLGFNQWPI